MNGTHASFFSGVGGTDLGLERAGFRTVSFSEVDPYACAVLAERWPAVPNLGDIVGFSVAEAGPVGDGAIGDQSTDRGVPDDGRPLRADVGTGRELVGADRQERATSGSEQVIASARLWTAGFPCQDLSVAGKRRGFTGERSVLAFAFLALVERHRPPAILLENVPGLLSSNGGRDMAHLVGEMAELGYGVAYRVLDAQHFGVPQRRRRVFILGLRSDPDDVDGRVAAERAAAVLSVGARCARHPATGHETGPGATERPGEGISHALPSSRTRSGRYDANGETFVSSSPDADRDREADGLARRPHDREQLAFVKSARPREEDGEESWIEGRVMPTLNSFDVGDVRTTAAVVGGNAGDDALLPLGLDSHRYRCCGNGVVAPVAEWLGLRLMEALA